MNNFENKYGLDLEIGGLWYTPFWKTNLFYVTFSLILLILLIIVFYKWWVRSKNLPKQKPILLLLQSLCEKEQKPISVSAQVFYFELIFKFKEFIGYNYGVQLAHQTDTEAKDFLIRAKVGSKQINEELIKTFLEILDRSHEVRFAKGSVSKEQMRSDLQQTINLMQQVIHQSGENL